MAPLKTIKDKNIPIKKKQGIINYSKPALYEKDKIGLPQVYKTPSFFIDGVKELQKQKVKVFKVNKKKNYQRRVKFINLQYKIVLIQ